MFVFRFDIRPIGLGEGKMEELKKDEVTVQAGLESSRLANIINTKLPIDQISEFHGELIGLYQQKR